MCGGLGGGCGGEGVTFVLAVLGEDGAGLEFERSLCGMSLECRLFALEGRADVEGESPGRGDGLEASGEEEAAGYVEEALRGV